MNVYVILGLLFALALLIDLCRRIINDVHGKH
jgi:hypothetical protein